MSSDEINKIRWDRWSSFEDSLSKSSAQDAKLLTKLVCLVLAHSWDPPSLSLSREIDRLRRGDPATSKSSSGHSAIINLKLPCFLIDVDNDPIPSLFRAQHQLSAFKPTLMLFNGGIPLTFRRQAILADDTSLSAVPTRENLWELFHYARSAENEGANILYLDF